MMLVLLALIGLASAGWTISTVGGEDDGKQIPLDQMDLGEYQEYRQVVFVTERTYWKAMIDFKDILYFYHNANHTESTDFRKQFLDNSPQIMKVNPSIKLAVFDIDVKMETAKKLDLKQHPTLRLFINKTQVSDTNVSKTPVRTYQDVIEWYQAALLKHEIDTKEQKVKDMIERCNITRLNSDYKESLTNNKFNLLYCSGDSAVKSVDKLNSTKHNFPELDVYFVSTPDIDCPASHFVLVKVHPNYDEYVTFHEKTHISYLTKALRKEVGQLGIVLGNQKQMKLILTNAFFGVVEENLYIPKDDPDHHTKMKALRVAHRSSELQSLRTRGEMITFIGDLSMNYIKKVIKRFSLESLVPPFSLCSISGHLYVQKLTANATDLQTFHDRCVATQLEDFDPSDTLEELSRRKQEIQFALREPIEKPHEPTLVIFVRNHKNSIEGCPDCQAIGLPYQAVFKHLYQEYGIYIHILIFNVARNLAPRFAGVNVDSIVPPYAELTFNGQSFTLPGQKPSDIMSVLEFIQKQTGQRMVYTDKSLVERLTDVIKQKQFDRRVKLPPAVRFIKSREGRIEKQTLQESDL